MSTTLVILMVLAALGTAGVLFTGIFSFIRGGEFYAKNGNRLMRMRVIMQGVTLVLFILVILSLSS